MKAPDPFSKFKIDQGNYCMSRLSALAVRAIELLKKYPNNKLSRTEIVADQLGVTRGTFMQHMSHHELSAYRTTALRGRALLWGNEPTIKEFKALKKGVLEDKLEHPTSSR